MATAIKTAASAPGQDVPILPDAPGEAEVLGFERGDYPYATKMGRRDYEAEKAKLQAELLKVQLWVQETGQKYVLLFEGRDAMARSSASPSISTRAPHVSWR